MALDDRTATPPGAARAPVDGERFGDYTLVGELGRGGFGTVHAAWDPRLQRRVALKILSVNDPEEADRFAREARLAAALSHPNIVAVYEVGRIGTNSFIAMQLVEGATLARTRLDTREALGAARDAARAVAYAHRQGTIHRDLKPANLMKSNDGRIYVLDFGLAKAQAGDASISVTGDIIGTPAYMSPEQARGQRATPRSDVYGLGAVLYELVTGQKPFDGDTAYDVIRQVIDADPTPPRRLRPRLSINVETIALKAMEKDPARRYADADAFADDIERELAGEPILARPASMAERVIRRVRKRPTLYALAAALTASLVGGVILLELNRRSTEQLRRLDNSMQQARERVRAADLMEFEQSFSRERWEGALGEAERLCEDATALRPDYATGWYEWGGVWMARRRWDRAIAMFDACLERDPDYVQARLARARARVESIFRIESHTRLGQEAPGTARREARRVAEALDDLAGLGGASLEDEQKIELRLLLHFLRAEWDAFDALAEGLDDWRSLRLRAESYHKRFDHPRAADAYAELVRTKSAAAWAWARFGHCCRDANDLGRATAAADRSVELDPRSVEALVERAYLRARLGDVVGFLADAERAVAADPADVAALDCRSTAYGAAGRLGEAAADSTARIALDPESSVGYYARGYVRLEAGDGAAAVADFDLALERDPDYLPAIYNRAFARALAGDFDGALADCDAAERADPSSVAAAMARGRVEEQRGDFAAAEAAYDAAIRAHPGAPEPLVARGLLRRQRGDSDGAIDDFSAALHRNPSMAELHRYRGLALLEGAGDPARALSDFERAVELEPFNPENFHNRAVARHALGDADGAIEDYSRAIDFAFGPSYVNRAALRAEAGDWAGALADCDARLAGAPDDFGALLTRSWIKSETGDWEGVIADAGRAIAVNAGDAAPYINRAIARESLGDAAGAKADWSKAVELAPDHPKAHAGLARLLEAGGDPEGARRVLDRLLDRQPDHVDARLERARLRAMTGDTAGALADATRAVELAPDNPATHADRARVRELMEDWAGAVADYERALEVAPADWPERAALEEYLPHVRRRAASSDF